MFKQNKTKTGKDTEKLRKVKEKKKTNRGKIHGKGIEGAKGAINDE